MFGPYDAKPSSGGLLVALVRGKVPGYTTGIQNFVDVRDVCRGMVLALEKGRTGERYILGNVNLTYRELFGIVERVANVRAPRLAVPRPLFMTLGWFGEIVERVAKREILLNTIAAKYAYVNHAFSIDKARRELGYSPGPIETAIEDALAWFRENGKLP
jgi:dihydroflavonol-4-reductase